MKAVLERAQEGERAGAGRCPPATAQGVGVHREYKGFAACVVEVDARPKTVNRKVTGGKTGPRVTRVTYVVDVGLPINLARPQGADDGRDHGRHRAGASPTACTSRTARSSRPAGTTPSTRASGTCRRGSTSSSWTRRRTSRAAPARSASPPRWPPRPAPTARAVGQDADDASRSPTTTSASSRTRSSRRSRSRPKNGLKYRNAPKQR